MSAHDLFRRSPLHDQLASERGDWEAVAGMQTAVRLPGDDVPAPIMLADASCLRRLGLKGPQAEAWLRSRGVSAPDANRWTLTPDGAIVARLARSEFFLEDRPGGTAVAGWRDVLEAAPGIYPPGICPVARQDAAIALAGERAGQLLAQTCGLNFRAVEDGRRDVVMTSMAGVSVLMLWHEQGGEPLYRIWCDGTFGPYLWETLLGIAREAGGRAVGFARLFPHSVGN
jgi:sarcosine oxidase subunit gamma